MKTTLATPQICRLLKDATLFGRDSMHLVESPNTSAMLSYCRQHPTDLVIITSSEGGSFVRGGVRSLKSLPKPPSVLLICDDPNYPASAFVDGLADDVVAEMLDASALIERCASLLGVPIRTSVRLLARIRLEAPDDKSARMLLGTIIDVSATGMRVESDVDIELGSAVSTQFFLQDKSKPMKVMAKIVRVQKRSQGYHLGLQFLTEELATLGEIRRFLESRGTKG